MSSDYNYSGQVVKPIVTTIQYCGLVTYNTTVTIIKTVFVNPIDTHQVILKTITSDYNYSGQVVKPIVTTNIVDYIVRDDQDITAEASSRPKLGGASMSQVN